MTKCLANCVVGRPFTINILIAHVYGIFTVVLPFIVWPYQCEHNILITYNVFCLLPFCSLAEGVVELWLTSEDTGAYGRDIGTTLPELLWQLVDVIPEGARMRIGMTNPPYILEHLEVRTHFFV